MISLSSAPQCKNWYVTLVKSRSDAKLIVVAALGRESALEAVRSHEGSHLTDHSATLRLEELLDLTLTVPNLEVRKIGSLLRTYVGEGEERLKRAFGAESIVRLSAATAHRPLGAPRFLQRLAHRVTLLAEYAVEAGTRELSESQWAWVVVSERWPDFRRFMIRGGRERWIDLRNAVAVFQKVGDKDFEVFATTMIARFYEETGRTMDAERELSEFDCIVFPEEEPER